jgi:hypothetical protein
MAAVTGFVLSKRIKLDGHVRERELDRRVGEQAGPGSSRSTPAAGGRSGSCRGRRSGSAASDADRLRRIHDTRLNPSRRRASWCDISGRRHADGSETHARTPPPAGVGGGAGVSCRHPPDDSGPPQSPRGAGRAAPCSGRDTSESSDAEKSELRQPRVHRPRGWRSEFMPLSCVNLLAQFDLEIGYVWRRASRGRRPRASAGSSATVEGCRCR